MCRPTFVRSFTHLAGSLLMLATACVPVPPGETVLESRIADLERHPVEGIGGFRFGEMPRFGTYRLRGVHREPVRARVQPAEFGEGRDYRLQAPFRFRLDRDEVGRWWGDCDRVVAFWRTGSDGRWEEEAETLNRWSCSFRDRNRGRTRAWMTVEPHLDGIRGTLRWDNATARVLGTLPWEGATPPELPTLWLVDEGGRTVGALDLRAEPPEVLIGGVPSDAPEDLIPAVLGALLLADGLRDEIRDYDLRGWPDGPL